MKQLQEPRTDDRRCQGDEGFVDPCRAIRSQSKFAKAMQPRVRSLDHPTVNAQPTAMFGTTVCEMGTDSSPSHSFSMGLRIVSAISEQRIGPSARMSNFAAYVGDRIHDMEQFFNVVNVGTRNRHGQRHALGIRNNVMLRPQFAAIRGVWACFLAPSQSPRVSAVHGRPRPINAVGFLKFGQKNLMKTLPNAGLLPGLEIVPTGHPATTTHL
jgi:hypothetical protein